MAHFILEYSTNLQPAELRLDTLFEALHAAAVGTGIFPAAGIRSRAVACDSYRIGDGAPRNAFAHLTVKVGPGRTPDVLQQAATVLNELFTGHFDGVYAARGLALSFELLELSALRFNKNNLRT